MFLLSTLGYGCRIANLEVVHKDYENHNILLNTQPQNTNMAFRPRLWTPVPDRILNQNDYKYFTENLKIDNQEFIKVSIENYNENCIDPSAQLLGIVSRFVVRPHIFYILSNRLIIAKLQISGKELLAWSKDYLDPINETKGNLNHLLVSDFGIFGGEVDRFIRKIRMFHKKHGIKKNKNGS